MTREERGDESLSTLEGFCAPCGSCGNGECHSRASCYPAGSIFGFRRKKLVGSYVFFRATNRS